MHSSARRAGAARAGCARAGRRPVAARPHAPFARPFPRGGPVPRLVQRAFAYLSPSRLGAAQLGGPLPPSLPKLVLKFPFELPPPRAGSSPPPAPWQPLPFAVPGTGCLTYAAAGSLRPGVPARKGSARSQRRGQRRKTAGASRRGRLSSCWGQRRERRLPGGVLGRVARRWHVEEASLGRRRLPSAPVAGEKKDGLSSALLEAEC